MNEPKQGDPLPLERRPAGYLAAVAVVGVTTALSALAFGRSFLVEVGMVYLLGVVIVALRVGFGPSLLAAVLSMLAFDFFFTHPYLSFAVSDLSHLVTFLVMLLVAVVISDLVRRVREQAAAARTLAEETQRARLEVEAERLRSSLLSSVSHDLRTPLAVMKGAASALLEGDSSLDPAVRRDLLESIEEEADRLNRLIRNLLDMTRLESGSLRVKKEWQPLEEVVGAALYRMDERLRQHEVTIALPDDLPLVPIDGLLIEQVLINLLENAAKYGGAEGPIELCARAEDGAVIVEVQDRGPGIPPGDRSHLFEKFYRGSREGMPGGVGLGLAICRGAVEAHGGRIEADERPGGGAVVRFTLPLGAGPPALDPLDLPDLPALVEGEDDVAKEGAAR